MAKPDIDTYQGRWPFEPTEAAHAASEITEDDSDPHRAARGIVQVVLWSVCVLSLLAALVMVALGVPK